MVVGQSIDSNLLLQVIIFNTSTGREKMWDKWVWSHVKEIGMCLKLFLSANFEIMVLIRAFRKDWLYLSCIDLIKSCIL